MQLFYLLSLSFLPGINVSLYDREVKSPQVLDNQTLKLEESQMIITRKTSKIKTIHHTDLPRLIQTLNNKFQWGRVKKMISYMGKCYLSYWNLFPGSNWYENISVKIFFGHTSIIPWRHFKICPKQTKPATLPKRYFMGMLNRKLQLKRYVSKSLNLKCSIQPAHINKKDAKYIFHWSKWKID